jgi:thioesterase domain-containing protein
VAYETARRLRAAGAEVALLALLDARLPRPEDEMPDLSSWEARANEAPASAEARRARALLEVNRAGLRALHAYRPEPYGGPALIFRPSDSRDGVKPPADAAEWSGLIAGPVTVVRTSGDHRTMLKPPAIETIASTLARAMAEILRPTEVKW